MDAFYCQSVSALAALAAIRRNRFHACVLRSLPWRRLRRYGGWATVGVCMGGGGCRWWAGVREEPVSSRGGEGWRSLEVSKWTSPCCASPAECIISTNRIAALFPIPHTPDPLYPRPHLTGPVCQQRLITNRAGAGDRSRAQASVKLSGASDKVENTEIWHFQFWPCISECLSRAVLLPLLLSI